MTNEPRDQVFDETIKNLEMKDCKALARLAIPEIEAAEEISLQFSELAMAESKKPDYVARVRLHGESFLLHLEFESSYKSNREMQRRMLRYCSCFYWNSDLPIYSVLVLMKPPEIKNVTGCLELKALGRTLMHYEYQVIKLYEMDKYSVLQDEIRGLYPLRVFMKHDCEEDLEHLAECLKVTETLEDPDYYYLTVECGKKLYGTEAVDKMLKEAIYMSSVLYKHPFEQGMEKGMQKGMEKGMEKGRQDELAKTVIKLLSRKFGFIPEEMKNRIQSADLYSLELIADTIFDLSSLEEAERLLPSQP